MADHVQRARIADLDRLEHSFGIHRRVQIHDVLADAGRDDLVVKLSFVGQDFLY